MARANIQPITFNTSMDMSLSMPSSSKSTIPVRTQIPPRIPREIALEMGDNKNIKAALQRAGVSSPQNLLTNDPVPPSSSYWIIGIVVVATIIIALIALLSLLAITNSNSNSSRISKKDELPRKRATTLRDWLPIAGNFSNSACGFGTRQHSSLSAPQYMSCEPDYTTLLDPIVLENKRRGTCAAPVSLSNWVCGEYDADRRNTGRRIVDDYLLSRSAQWIADALSGKSSSTTKNRGPFIEQAVVLCSPLSESSPLLSTSSSMLERLRREVLSADSWTVLSRALGVAAAFDVPLFVCISHEDGSMARCAPPVTDTTLQDTLRENLFCSPSADSHSTSELLLFDLDAFYVGVVDGWKRAGASYSSTPAALRADSGPNLHLPNCIDFHTAPMERWRRYFAQAIQSYDKSLRSEYVMREEFAPFIEAYFVRELSAKGGPLDRDGSSAVGYLQRAFEQLRDAFIESVRESAFLADENKARFVEKLQAMRLFVPPFDALSSLAQSVDAAASRATKCHDLVTIARAARTARGVSQAFSVADLRLAAIDLFHVDSVSQAFRIVRYESPPIDAIIVAPLALTSALYQPPTDDAYYSMVDAFGRLGWRISREIASALHQPSLTEQLAMCAAYRVLCKHSATKCTSLDSSDIDWIRRFLWDVASTSCGDRQQYPLIDAAANSYALYRVAFACNGMYLFKNSSAEALDCWKR